MILNIFLSIILTDRLDNTYITLVEREAEYTGVRSLGPEFPDREYSF